MYKWKMICGKTSYEGEANTLQSALDYMIYYSFGRQVQDFYINGHHMNEKFQLWICDNKVIHDDGEEFVPMNKWYEILKIPSFVQTSTGACMEAK